MEHNTVTAEQPDYLTVAEVSSLFRVSMPTVYRRVADGQLPAVRIGATIRIPLSAVEPRARRRGDGMSDRPWDMSWWEYAAQQGLPTSVGRRTSTSAVSGPAVSQQASR
jgi:excisionase family DNA binding protein